MQDQQAQSRAELYAAMLRWLRLARAPISQHKLRFALEDLAESQPNLAAPDWPDALWPSLGLEDQLRQTQQPRPDELPALLRLPDGQWRVLEVIDARGAWLLSSALGQERMQPQAGVTLWVLPPVAARARAAKALPLIARSLMRHKRVLWQSGLATLLLGGLGLMASLYAMQVYDRVIPTAGLDTLWVLTVGFVVAALFEFIVKRVRGHAADAVAALVDNEVSRELTEHLLASRLDERPPEVGTLAAQVRGFEQVRQILTSTTLFAMVDLPLALLFLLVIGLLGGWLVLAPLVAVLLCLGVGFSSRAGLEKLAASSLTNSHKKLGTLVEMLEAAETLKTQGGAWRMLRRFNHLTEQGADDDLSMRILQGNASYILALLQSLGYAGLIALGAWLAVEGQISQGVIFAAAILNGRAVQPLVQIPMLLLQWAQAKMSLRQLDRLLALKREDDGVEHGLAPERIAGRLQLEPLRFGYAQNPQPSLRLERPLSVAAGECIGLIGEVGAGKSTLLKLLAGLYQPQDGRIMLDGLAMGQLHPDFLRENLAYLPQDYRLLSGTLRENLTLGLADPGDEALLAACRRTGLDRLVARHPQGLTMTIGEAGQGLSGGQRQLVGLTRLLLAQAPVWLLDEPTASLDGDSEQRILQLLAEESRGRTVLISTHKTMLLSLCGRIWMVLEGRVAMDGPRDAVMRQLQAARTGQAGQELAKEKA